MTASLRPLRLGWFSTGRGEGSRGLLTTALNAISSGRLNAAIEFVFCNRERGQAEGSDRFIELVESRGLPLVAFSSQQFRKEHGGAPWASLRELYDEAAAERLSQFRPDIVVNAGYMLIAPLLCSRFRMINLHPALPGGPAGMWQQVIWELIATGAEESGAMVHVVTVDLDGGPVLSFCRFSLRGPEVDPLWREIEGKGIASLKAGPGEELPLFAAIRQAGLIRERPLLVETLRALSLGRIDAAEAGNLTPLDLTDAVEAAVREP